MAALGTGVTIGARTIRVLQVRKGKSGWQVVRALIAPLGDAAAGDAQRVAEARAALASAQVRGGALIGLSGKDLIVRYTHVPPVPDWRLEMLMNFEIQEVAEQSGGDVSAAYAQLEIDDATSGDNVVLVALAKNGHLKPRLEALKAAGLDPLGGCPRAVAAYWAYRENAKLGADETVLLMHIGHDNTDVAIARKGVLIFARNVTGGSRLFTDAIVQNLRLDPATAEKSKVTKGNLTPRGKAKYRDAAEEKVANALMGVAGHFVSAVNSSLMFAKAQTKVPECQPTRVVLMGSGALLKGMPEYMESSLGLPVELFDPIPTLDLSALPEKTAAALKQDQGGMAVTLGLAQMAADEHAFRVDIQPEADRRRRRFLQHTAFSIAAAVVLGVSLAVAWTMLSSASGQALAESDLLTQKATAHGRNDADMERERARTREANREMDLMTRLVALGPTTQRVTDVVHQVVNEGQDVHQGQPVTGYDEIHFLKVASRFVTVEVPAADSGSREGGRGREEEDTRREKVPQVEFEAAARNVSARSPNDAYVSFATRLRERVLALKTFDEPKFDRIDPQTKTFKFTVRAKSPSELALEARAAADEQRGGEEKR